MPGSLSPLANLPAVASMPAFAAKQGTTGNDFPASSPLAEFRDQWAPEDTT